MAILSSGSRRPARLLRAVAVLALALGGLTCRDRELVGPGIAGRATLALAPTLSTAPGGPVLVIRYVRAQLGRVPDGTPVVLDTTADFPVGDSTLSLSLSVPVIGPSQQFVLRLTAMDASHAVIYSAQQTVTVEREGTGSATPTPVPVTLTYAGADTVVATLAIAPRDTSVNLGDSVAMRAVAKRSDATTVAAAIGWTSRDTSVVDVTAAGMVHPRAVGGPVWIIGATANGRYDSTQVTIRRPVASVILVPDTASAYPLDTLRFAPTLKDALGGVLTGRPITWSTPDVVNASVSSTGLVTALAVGNARIIATSEGKADTSILVVKTPPVASVTLSIDTGTVARGSTLALTATLKDAHGTVLTGRPITWTSSAPANASVDGAGTVTGLKADSSAKVIAASGTVADTAVILVGRKPNATVVVAPDTVKLLPTMTATFTATPKDASGAVNTDNPITWTVADASIATISSSGIVTAVAPGTTTATASSGGASGAGVIVVSAVPVKAVDLTPDSLHFFSIGDTARLTATTKDSVGGVLTGRVVTWVSRSPATATVNTSGLVTAVAAGVTYVVATSEGVKDSALVNITPGVATVVTTPDTVKLASLEASSTVAATAKDGGGTTISGTSFTWTTTDGTVATVTSAGVVTSHANGTAKIIATASGKADTTTVVVQQVAASLVVTPTPDTIALSDTVRLTATAKDANGYVVTPAVSVTWSATPTGIVVVDAAGLVTGTSPGSATVTATVAGGPSGSAAVEVIRVAPAAATRVWTSGDLASPTNWSSANNWSPAGVPVATDTVYIKPTARAFPTLTSDQTVGGVIVGTGGSLNLGGFNLTVTGLVDAGNTISGSGTLKLTAPVRLSGRVPKTDIGSTVTLMGPTIIDGNVTIGTSGNLNVNSTTLTVNGKLITSSSGVLTMTGVGEVVTVTDSVIFSGGSTSGKLTAGILHVKGNFVQTSSFSSQSYAPSSGQLLVFDGTSPQTLNIAAPTLSKLGSLSITNSSGVTALTSFQVQGNTSVSGPITGSGFSATLSGDLADSGGNWHMGTTVITKVGSLTLPTALATNLSINGVVSLVNNLALTGDLTLNQELALGGHTVTVSGNLATAGSGLLTMDNASDAMTVAGSATFSGNSTSGKLTNGVLVISGSFSQTNTFSSFSFLATGSHTTVLTGSGSPQTVSFTNPTLSQFANVQFSGSAGTTLLTSFKAVGTATANGLVSGSSVTGTVGALVDPLGTNWRAGTTVITGKGLVSLPTSMTTNLFIDDSLALGANTTLTGDLQLGGVSGGTSATDKLNLNGRRLDVSGKFRTKAVGAVLIMQTSADSLVVGDSTFFDGGDETGLLTNGVIVARGHFRQQNDNSSFSFVATSSHKTAIAGTGATQNVSFVSPTLSQFANVEFSGAGGTNLATNIKAIGTATALSNVAGAGIFATVGGLVDPGGAFWRPANTVFTGKGLATIPTSMTTALFIDDSLALSANTAVTGDVQLGGVSGGSSATDKLNLLGRKLTVTGKFRTKAVGAVVIMQNAADSLVVSDSVFFDGGDETGLLTNGTVVVGGHFKQFNDNSAFSFVGSASHKVAFTGSSLQNVFFQNPTLSQFANVDFKGAGGASLATNFKAIGTATATTLVSSGSTITATVNGLVDATGLNWRAANTDFTGKDLATIPTSMTTNLFVDDSLALSANTSVTGNVQVGVSGGTSANDKLNLNGRKLTVTGKFRTSVISAVLIMKNSADSLVVSDSAFFDGGDESSLLSDGTIVVAGHFRQLNDNSAFSFVGTGNNTVVLNGTATQDVRFQSPTLSQFANVEFKGTGGTTLQTNFKAIGTVTATTLVSSGSTITATTNGLVDVTGLNWRAANTDFTGKALATIPTSMTTNLFIDDSLALNANTTLVGDLQVGVSGGTAANDKLNLNGHRMDVTGKFRTFAVSAVLIMKASNDSLTTTDSVLFDGGDETGLLTDGTIVAGGHFRQMNDNSSFSFVASGNHLTVLSGSSARTVRFASPTLSNFQNLKLELPSTTFSTDAVAKGTVTDNAPASGAVTVTIGASLIDPPAVDWTVGTTIFSGASPSIPSTMTSNVTFSNTATVLPSGSTITGNVSFTGTVDLNGNTLDITGDFATTGTNGKYKSIAAGSILIVRGNALFAGGDVSGLVTAGELRVTGNLTQSNVNSTFSLVASGTHKTTFNGSTTQTISFASPGPTSSRLKQVELNNSFPIISGNAASIASRVVIDSSLVITNGLIGGADTVVVARNLVDAAGNHFQASFLRLTDSVPSLPANVITHVVFGGSTTLKPTRLQADFIVNGSVTIFSNDTLVLNGHTLRVNNDFAVQGSSARLKMTNANDSLIVQGNATFNGADETGILSNGVIKLGMAFIQNNTNSSSSFNASGSHRVWFDATGPHTAGFKSSGSSQFQNVTLSAAVSQNATIDPFGTARVAGTILDTLGGRWQMDSTTFTGTTFGDIRGNNSVQTNAVFTNTTGPILFATNATITGNVTTQGTLDINIKNVTISGDFKTATSNGMLKMVGAVAPDFLSVGGNATFAGGNEAGLLTSGTLVIQGDFTQSSAASPASYSASGTHTLRFTGTGSHTISIASGPVSSSSTSGRSLFQNVQVLNGTADDLRLTSGVMHVLGTLTLGSTARLSIAGSTSNRIHDAGAPVFNSGHSMNITFPAVLSYCGTATGIPTNTGSGTVSPATCSY